ncbi:hypothetical protein CKO51_11710 [Rhodopirellula sp. SM50]|nr:hypothetical protein CKO51_11710 [Rhodopirellula sp. SM50]
MLYGVAIVGVCVVLIKCGRNSGKIGHSRIGGVISDLIVIFPETRLMSSDFGIRHSWLRPRSRN